MLQGKGATRSWWEVSFDIKWPTKDLKILIGANLWVQKIGPEFIICSRNLDNLRRLGREFHRAHKDTDYDFIEKVLKPTFRGNHSHLMQ